MTLPKEYNEDNINNIRIYHYVEELIRSNKAYMESIYDDEEITLIESAFLVRISFLGNTCTQKDLVEIFRVSEGYNAKILRKFEDLKLITRYENPENHRIKIVKLTGKGRTKAEHILTLMDTWEENVMKQMDEKQRNNLKRGLYNLVKESEKF